MKITDYVSPMVVILDVEPEYGFAQSGNGNFEQPVPGNYDPFSGSAWD